MIMRWSLMAMLLLTASTARSTPWLLPEWLQRKEVAMSVSNGIITAPGINPEEIYRLLGVAKHNGWWDIGYICSNAHGKTNKWAKFKPVDWGGSVGVNVTNTEWHKGQNGLCGYNLIYGEASLMSLMIQDALQGGTEWAYTPGSLSCRILDFEGYNHNSVNPFVSSIIDYKFTKSTAVSSAVIYSNQYESAYNIDGNFVLTDLEINGSSCANWYSGVLIVDKSWNFVAGVTANTTIAQDVQARSSKVNIAPEIMDEGEYYIIPIISSVKKYGEYAVYAKYGDSWNDGIIAFLPIAVGGLEIFSVMDSIIWYQVQTTDTQVSLNLVGTNKSNYATHIGNVKTYIEYYDDRAAEEGSNDPWVLIYSSEDTVGADIPANTEKYEFRFGGALAKADINWQKSTRYRVTVEAPDNPGVSSGVTQFRDDGNIYE